MFGEGGQSCQCGRPVGGGVKMTAEHNEPLNSLSCA